MNEKIFKMTNDGIFINSHDNISFSKTNLPIDGFAFLKDVYWKVRITKEVKGDESVLNIEVINYYEKDDSLFKAQSLKGEVPFMCFLPFTYEHFSHQVACLKNGLMRSLCKDHPLGSIDPIDKSLSAANVGSQFSSEKIEEKREKDKKWVEEARADKYNIPTKTTKILVKHRLVETTIRDGQLEFSRLLKDHNKTIQFIIKNEYLKKEYDLLKEYFCNRLGKKTFTADITLQFLGSNIESVEATSEDIALIDHSFIEKIRVQQINSLRRIAGSDTTKKLFSIDEIFNHASDISSNIFNSDINEIIKVLTDGYKHRNSSQILYLAKSHDAKDEKVRLTLKPLFGFLFYIETSNQHHFIWELLDSHATYIWTFQKSLFSQSHSYGNVELAINEVHEIGRNSYKSDYKKKVTNYQFVFTPIEHELSENNNQVVFENWKKKLESIILP